MDVHPPKNGIYRYWSIAISRKCMKVYHVDQHHSTHFNPQDDKLQVAVRGPRLRNFSAGSLQLRSACGQRLDLGSHGIPNDIFLIDIDWLYMIIYDYIYIYPNISRPWEWVIGLEYDDSWEIQCHVEPLDPFSPWWWWCGMRGTPLGESGLHDARREAGADRLRGLHEVVGMWCHGMWMIFEASEAHIPIHNIKERLPCMSKGKVTLVTDTFWISW